MGSRDIHKAAFDGGTLNKLEIFSRYASAWIPTFVMSSQWHPEIHIFDFFAGPGHDTKANPGTPLLILEKVMEHSENIRKKNSKIVVHLNEYEPKKKTQKKFIQLIKTCNEYLEKNPGLNDALEVRFYNQGAENLFYKLLPSIREYPSLVYLDQNGVKFISQKYILELEKTKTTDFLIFVASSFFRRFNYNEVLEISKEEQDSIVPHDIHRLVLDKIKLYLPNKTQLKIYSFSLKKGSNYYGIIFGSKHYAAVDKFLSIAWNTNKKNGEANFDIDQDDSKGQMTIFDGKSLTKIEKFEQDFEESLLMGEIPNNKDALSYTYNYGHIPKHAKIVLERSRKSGKISYQDEDGKEAKGPAISYDQVFKKKKKVNYNLNQKYNGTIKY